MNRQIVLTLSLALGLGLGPDPLQSQGIAGYYRVHGNPVVFVAEGDFWKTTTDGGVAQRLTTHQSEETRPQLSPDGRTLAFSWTLHMFVRGGDIRSGDENVLPASLGATLSKVEGGWRIDHIYRSDPDIVDERGPLAKPGVDITEGDVITAINGASLAASHPSDHQRNQAGNQVLVSVSGKGDRIVTPITQGREQDLRYDEWEYTRRLMVDELSEGKIGYVHIRNMGTGGITEFVREYYPVFNREGLIIDVRNNTGGNIDTWLLSRLMHKAWFDWKPRVGETYSNMPYAFKGAMVVLVNERTASDGEAFAEGFRRLGLGKVIGTRTWGGEVWLSSSNNLLDRGIATAAEQAVYDFEGKMLIEGWGVDPDIVVDNPPAGAFGGRDLQLEAVRELRGASRR